MIYWQRISEKYSIVQKELEVMILNHKGVELQKKIEDKWGVHLSSTQIERVEESFDAV